MMQGGGAEASGPVGEHGDACDFETKGSGLDCLRHGGHADGICAEGANHANLGWRLVLRPEDGGIDAFVKRGGEFAGCGRDSCSEVEIIDSSHVEKVRTTQKRRGAKEVQVIGD